MNQKPLTASSDFSEIFGKKLDFGGGCFSEQGYTTVNTDAKMEPDFLLDVFRPLPFPDCYISEIRAFHILEHASHTETVSILKEWHRVLMPNGKLEVYVPNLTYYAFMILKNRLLGRSDVSQKAVWGNQTLHASDHRSGFTVPSLSKKLEEAGFVRIKVGRGRTWRELYATAYVYSVLHNRVR